MPAKNLSKGAAYAVQVLAEGSPSIPPIGHRQS